MSDTAVDAALAAPITEPSTVSEGKVETATNAVPTEEERTEAPAEVSDPVGEGQAVATPVVDAASAVAQPEPAPAPVQQEMPDAAAQVIQQQQQQERLQQEQLQQQHLQQQQLQQQQLQQQQLQQQQLLQAQQAQQAEAGAGQGDFNKWLLRGVEAAPHQSHWGQPQQQYDSYAQLPQQHQQQHAQYDAYGMPMQPVQQLVLPDLPICPFEVKKLRVPEIKAMLNSRGVHQEYMQGVLKKNLLEMLLTKLEEEGNLKEDPPSKKPRVYIEDDGEDEEEIVEEESEEYDPNSDESGAEQEDDDDIDKDDGSGED